MNSFIPFCVILIMKSLSCRDVGFDCDYSVKAENDYQLFTKGERHVFNEHGLREEHFITKFNENVKSEI
jgi:predicted small metal-binding protein